MKNKIVKRFFAVAMTLVITMTGLILYPEQRAEANETTDPVIHYQDFIYADFTGYVGKSAPACELTDGEQGYLFAGWFKDDKGKTPIKSSGDVNATDNATVWAKFVSANVAGIACQARADVETSTTGTSLRVVTPVHSYHYQAVGFNVYGHGEINGVFQDWTMFEYKEDGTNRAEYKKVYENLLVYKTGDNGELSDPTPNKPADVFGAGATDEFYFSTVNLTGFSKDLYNLTISVQPYWITMDGVYVEGMAEFNCVNDTPQLHEDGKGIVNISVNLKEAGNIAAGLVNVSYDKEKFTYVGYETGRVFEEMDIHVDETTGTIKCVGNTSTAKDSLNADDVYINLKFKKIAGNDSALGESEFLVEVPTEGFCNSKEVFVDTVKAWNVKY